MDKRNNIKGSLILTLTALIWGLAFVAQDGVSDKMPPMSVNALRFLGAFFLLALFFKIKYGKQEKIFPTDKSALRLTLKGSIICGAALAVAAYVQQAGITAYPKTVAVSARGGFLTALYVIIVPVMSVFLHKKIKAIVWLAVAIAIAGVYLICFSGSIDSIYLGDIMLIGCSFCFSLHIIFVDKYCEKIGGLRLACLQFLFCGIISALISLIFESKGYAGADIKGALPYLLYLGLFSSAIGYTLQVVGQKFAEPYIASLTMSLESVFAALGGLAFGTTMKPREIIGSALVFAAIIIAQTPEIFEAVKNKKTNKKDGC